MSSDARADRAHRAGDERSRAPAATSTESSEGWLRRLPETPTPVFAAACWTSVASVLEVFERRRSGDGMAGGELSQRLLHLGFALESADAVDELTGVLAAAGHRVLEPPQRAGERGRYESVVLDPDGNRLKLTV